VDFSLTPLQRELQESIDKALLTISPLDRVRRQAQTGQAFAADLWQALVELGVTGLLIPERLGGLGLGVLDAALVAEMLGRHVVPAPFLGPAVLAPLAVMQATPSAQQDQWLRAMAAGRLRMGVALSEQAAGRRAGAGVVCKTGRLYGRSLFAIDGSEAQQFLVVDDSLRLHLVDRDAPGLMVTALSTIDRTRSTVSLDFDATPGIELAPLNNKQVQRLVDAARLILAADMLGASSKMLAQAVDYAKLREQFGRPIGSFQAVKHMCAEMAAELEPARALVWYAGYAIDEQLPDATLASLHAKSYLAEASRLISRTATEVHGGMGITDALGLHYWFKRNAWNYQALGGPERLRELAAQLQEPA
jgi:alkylation response protein AidB-like acyl-CoA dehydrogenase